MKVNLNIKDKIRIKELVKKGKGLHFRRRIKTSEGSAPASESFGARVYSSEPILKMEEPNKQAAWKTGLVSNIACAILLTTIPALFCMSIDSPEFIPFVLTCPVIFMVIATIDSVKPGKIRWIASAAAAVILLAAAIIWRTEIFGGFSMLINRFYDAAEEAQAYLYDRLPAGYDATDGEAKAGLAWASAFLGLIGALPPAKMRRAVSGAIAIIIMLVFAYYGIVPSAICIAVMTAALITAVARGNMLSFIPVILAALVLFGAVMLVDPGESYGISRMNENFRDRFAFKSALLESDYSQYDDMEEDYDEIEDEEEVEDYEEDEPEIVTYAVIGFIILAVAAIGAVAYLLYRRISKKRAQIRKGIDSTDAREAVMAMFPYAVRWLKGYGIEQTEPTFASMEPALKSTFSESYAHFFMDMYKVWSEAAYSDHDVTDRTRLVMETFTKDTVNQVKNKCKLRDKLKLKLLYAL